MSDFLQDLNDLLFNANTLPICMYGKYSRLGISVSSKDRALQLSVAKAIDPDNNTGKAEKGEARYDNDTAVMFTLSANECYHILTNLKTIIDGTYINKKATDPKFANRFQLTHFMDSKPSILTFVADDKKRLKLTIKPVSGEALSFIFNENPDMGFYERSIFQDFLRNSAQNGPYQLALFKSNIKAIRAMYFQYFKNKKNGLNKSKQNIKNNHTNNQNNDNDADFSTPQDNSYVDSSINSDMDDFESHEF